jgi:mono/diheme cytochrome c family protein
MPRWLIPLALLLACAALVPFALIARARVARTDTPRIHIIQDMDNQARFKAQQENELFADRRAMRPPVPGTVARGELREDDHFYRGLNQDGGWAQDFPAQVVFDEALFVRGQDRYQVFCAPCHGTDGYGHGPVAMRADELKRKGRAGMDWTQPTDYHSDDMRAREPGYLFHVISRGIRTMPPYAAQIPAADRWAIVAHVKALQRSQNPQAGDLNRRSPRPAPPLEQVFSGQATSATTSNTSAPGGSK